MHVTPGIARRRSPVRFARSLIAARNTLLVRPVACQRRSHGVLHRDGAAQAAVRQLLDGCRHVVEARRCADGDPTRAPAGRKVRFRQTRERDDGGVALETADWRDRAVVTEIAVNLVGQHRETVPLGEVDQLTANRRGITGPCRIVRIDDDERTRRRCDEAAEMIEVRNPPAARMRAVVHGAGAELGDDRRVERVRRQRHEHLVAVIDQRAQRELDSLGRARGHDHAIGRHRPAATRVLRGDRLPGRRDAGGWAVSIVTVRDRALHRIDHVLGRFETEGNRIADVQVTNASAARFHALRFGDDIADGIGELAHAGRDGNGGLDRIHLPILQRELFGSASRRPVKRRKYYVASVRRIS